MSSTQYNVIELRQQLHTLRQVAREYSGKTIDNIIQQLELRYEEIGKIKIKEILQ